IFWAYVAEGVVRLGPARDDVIVEAQRTLADALADDVIKAGERAADDEQHVGGVDLDEILVRMLPPTLRRHGRRSSLQDLQQCLLDAFARDIAGDRRVLALPGDLVDLVDVDDPRLSLLDIEVGRLDQLEQDVLDVLADVAGLGQRRGICDPGRHIEHLRQRLGKIGLAAAGRTDQQDVGLGQLDPVILYATPRIGCLRLHALVVVINRNGQGFLCIALADDVAIKKLADLMWLGQLLEQADLAALGEFFLDDLIAEVYTFVADVDPRTSDELLYLLLALPAERALQ